MPISRPTDLRSKAMQDPTPSRLFVSTAWLAEHLDEPGLQVVDASWYLPTQGRDGRQEYEAGHVPSAIYFDLDAVSDHASSLPHMLLDEAAFGREAGELGLSSNATLVVYDGAGLFSAPRVWWTLRLFGAREVLILEGGLPQWKAEGRPLETGPSRAAPAHFAARQTPGKVADLEAVRRALTDGGAQVVDARPAARFRGEAAEPRAGLDSGHMPGSFNVPFAGVVADGRLRDADGLRQAFGQAGVDLARPVVASCGSGVSAAILVLAMESLGKTDAALYDGSWTEYASRPGLPIAKG